jgi:hypothetical protein
LTFKTILLAVTAAAAILAAAVVSVPTSPRSDTAMENVYRPY